MWWIVGMSFFPLPQSWFHLLDHRVFHFIKSEYFSWVTTLYQVLQLRRRIMQHVPWWGVKSTPLPGSENSPRGKEGSWVFIEGKQMGGHVSGHLAMGVRVQHGFVVVDFVVAQSCPTLYNPMNCSPPGSSVHGIFQVRIVQWVANSFSRGAWPQTNLDSSLKLSHSPVNLGKFYNIAIPPESEMTTVTICLSYRPVMRSQWRDT